MSRYDREYLGAWRHTTLDDECPVLVVGEDNPQSADPRHALYPLPAHCAGWNYAENIANVGTGHHLATWRTNLCSPKWSAVAAKKRAIELITADGIPWRTIVMLGRKVTSAFVAAVTRMHHQPQADIKPFGTARALHRVHEAPSGTANLDWIVLASLPHPSGRCRDWNFSSNVMRARALLAQVAPTWYSDAGAPSST